MQMTLIDPALSTLQLLRLAAENHQKKISLSEDERLELVSMLKVRGQDELDYGQELEIENVRLVRRVNGAVGLYFS